MKLRLPALRTSASLAAATAFAVVAAGAPAWAQVRGNVQAEQSQSLRDRLFSRNLPANGRYVSETGQGFILDRSASTPLLRFDRSVETWVLRPTPAPRGDVLYRNDAGDLVLRVTPDGGMTLYTRAAPGGSPVTLAGPGESLAPPALGPVQLFNLMARRSALVSSTLGRLVEINLSVDRSEALSVDALIVTTDAVIRMARSATARGYLTRLRSITIVEGDRVSATYARGDLRIVVDPDRGPAGRPSSARIINAFADEPRRGSGAGR
ncbi:MAG: DUF4908 domain-containing protein [Brevundimonas sp.]|uniref:DUF4908 domain-containing protein n=1 Tax=Brevundimonas sp. TaxID=1871086 RepID=UPI0025C1E9B3|nr:DUF4908 domain-containing protein [Brevundimonas sp.]MBX3477104.1 DUF4908 domain-containing protein [Brevundimonas sp.]